jgi:hypothetical protein
VLPNGAIIKFVVRDGMATVSLLTPDGEHDKFLKKEHVLEVFPSPIPFHAPACVVYLVRHGESQANICERYENPFLTVAGGEDAKRAGEAILTDLDGEADFCFVSSPLTRAFQTAYVIMQILRTSKPIVLDVRCIESVRDMGRPIHTRGPTASADTVIACNPNLSLSAYRREHICNPTITEGELEKLVAPNRIPMDIGGTDTSLLFKQLEGDWSAVAARTRLDELVASH